MSLQTCVTLKVQTYTNSNQHTKFDYNARSGSIDQLLDIGFFHLIFFVLIAFLIQTRPPLLLISLLHLIFDIYHGLFSLSISIVLRFQWSYIVIYV